MMLIPRRYVCSVLALLFGLLTASSYAGETSQRSLFISVEKSLKRGDSKLYLKHRKALSDYPLAGYLEYLYLTKRFKNVTQEDVQRFAENHPDLPQASQLHFQWLAWLAAKGRWREYLDNYARIGDQGGRYQCLKARALLATGNKKAAWQEAERLWLIGKSQHKACDPLFRRWKAAGKLTQQLSAKRFWMAVAMGNTSLARYIDRGITQQIYKKDTKLFWKIRNRPYLLSSTRSLDGNTANHRIIMIYGLKRLSSRDKEKAVNIWLKLKNRYPFTQDQLAKIDRKLALKYAKNFSDNADEQVSRLDPDYRYSEITEWRVRLALAKQDWEQVLFRIQKLPQSLQDSSRWLYWSSVARLKSKNETRGQLDRSTLAELNQERSFYSFLVADISGKPFPLNHEQASHQLSDVGRLFSKYHGFARIKEWLHHKRTISAQSELNLMIPALSSRERKLLPYLAQSFEWHHQAIMGAAREAMWNDLTLRFPTPQSNLFNKHALRQGLDYSWVISIARQESAFNPKARSHAGARGLMQLMPATAKMTARQSRIPYRRVAELYTPETNIALGTAHLAWLSRQFEGNRVLSTAAYNAGYSAVKRWLKKRGHLPLDIWIETIPYDETRGYVQNVLAFRVIYSQRSNDKVRMFTPSESARLALTPAEQTLLASHP